MSKNNSKFPIQNSTLKEGFYLSEEGELIPEGWDIVNIENVGKTITGKTPSKNNPHHWGDKIDFITPSDYTNSRSISNIARKLSVDGEEAFSKQITEPGSIAVSCIGSDMGKVILTKNRSLTNQQINTLCVDTNHSNVFWYYRILQSYRLLRSIAEGGGSTMPIINKGQFENISLTAPKFEEQKAIAAVLSSLDDKIELLREQNETIEALAQTLFKRWFIDFNFPCLHGYATRTQADYPELNIYGHKDFGGMPQPQKGSPAPEGQAGRSFIYVLRLKNGNRYVGLTDFLLRRYHEHKTGKGAKATKASPPVAMIHFEEFDSRVEAAEREQWLKTGYGRKWLDREEEKGNLGAHVVQAPMIPSELGEIPEGWSVVNLDKVLKNVKKGVKASDIIPDDKYVGLEHIQKKHLQLTTSGKGSDVSSNKSRFSKGDILFGKLRPYFHKVCIAPYKGICSTDILVLNSVDKHWFSYTLMHVYSERLIDYVTLASTGTRMPRASFDHLASYSVALPADDLADQFNGLVKPFFSKAESNTQQIQTLTHLRDTLLPKLMKGEIRIKNVK